MAACDGGGNITGVVYDDVGLAVNQMRRIAADLGAPTTGFVRRKSDREYIVRRAAQLLSRTLAGLKRSE